LRATAATNALNHQADIAKVQEWLGHANISRTLIAIIGRNGTKTVRHLGCVSPAVIQTGAVIADQVEGRAAFALWNRQPKPPIAGVVPAAMRVEDALRVELFRRPSRRRGPA
jgi:hypothetical protein